MILCILCSNFQGLHKIHGVTASSVPSSYKGDCVLKEECHLTIHLLSLGDLNEALPIPCWLTESLPGDVASVHTTKITE
jgi:hypothetical protein